MKILSVIYLWMTKSPLHVGIHLDPESWFTMVEVYTVQVLLLLSELYWLDRG